MTTATEKIVLSKPGIGCKSGTDQHGCNWLQYNVNPVTRDYKDSCLRFIDECRVCGQLFDGLGWICLDGGDTACDNCVSF